MTNSLNATPNQWGFTTEIVLAWIITYNIHMLPIILLSVIIGYGVNNHLNIHKRLIVNRMVLSSLLVTFILFAYYDSFENVKIVMLCAYIGGFFTEALNAWLYNLSMFLYKASSNKKTVQGIIMVIIRKVLLSSDELSDIIDSNTKDE